MWSVTGCASGQDDDVRATAHDFYAAVAEHDGTTACSLLAPATRAELEQSSAKPCVKALLDEDLPSVDETLDVQSYGTMARVRFDGEVVFMARFPTGWRVMAAACTPQPAGPYDCKVKGA